MKKVIIIFVLLVFSVTFSFAQDSDYSKVEKVVTYYLEGDTNRDFEMIKKAFHTNANMKYFSTSKNEYREYNALEVFKGQKKTGDEPKRINKISYINITGTAASAKLEVEYLKATVIDYVNLLKIDGEWKIVNKIYTVLKKDKSN